MKDSTRFIKDKFDEVYEVVNKKYPIDKPKLKVVHYHCSTAGRFKSGMNKVYINSHTREVTKVILHELCHAVNYFHFRKGDKKLGHNKQFWLLCYEFGLTENDYYFGLTKNMERAKEEILCQKTN